MGLYKTLGGNRLGSGRRIQTELETFNKSTFNLSKVIRTSMACGVLTPTYRQVVLKEDTFRIKMEHRVYTMPTNGPLFGSFKGETHFFFCPNRLYQGILHNNTQKIGNRMAEVKYPVFITDNWNANNDNCHVDNSCLLAYLGLREVPFEREMQELNAVPMLAYDDIFKNFFANQQEPNAKVIGVKKEYIPYTEGLFYKLLNTGSGGPDWPNTYDRTFVFDPKTGSEIGKYSLINQETPSTTITLVDSYGQEFNATGFFLSKRGSRDSFRDYEAEIKIAKVDGGPSVPYAINYSTLGYRIKYPAPWEGEESWCWFYPKDLAQADGTLLGSGTVRDPWRVKYSVYTFKKAPSQMVPDIIDFPLENLDKARRTILKNCELGDQVVVGLGGTTSIPDAQRINWPPYSIQKPFSQNELVKYPMGGLLLKTYASDMFNNWLESETIDGDNGIADITAIKVEDGKFKLDQLAINKKLYRMLNSVQVSGNTYQDWEEATTGYRAYGQNESPIYLGGQSFEIQFQEVVSTADTDTTKAGDQPLGTLAGRGIATNYKGGNIKFTANESGFVIGITSITPRVDYSQGNAWYLKLTNGDAYHKPYLDEIGFQDLMAEQMAGRVGGKKAIGKQTSWLHYQTDVNETFGDFGYGGTNEFMVLNRNYDAVTGSSTHPNGGTIKDATTYIDPQKYNYPFAKTDLTAQNFWVQIGLKISTRRLMKAKQMPRV